ncbi:chromate transporter [Wansuia hejianensis]|uniref:Chromate transporter n=1 Tax=Wansuia hejianensis TaxID=2763667 RepID=A0A7G9GD82_9FIRM|nr:chromate transporter [Wansuia hejianensis]QNM08764.1 chromate transporter [Wansuia hejianensis]
MKSKKDLAWMFCINLFISAFTFGGGYVVIPMIRKYYVEKKRYFDEEELMKIAAIAQSSPGAIAVNMSALSGYRVAGRAGLAVGCVAAVLPPLIILAAVSAVYALIRDNAVVNAVLKGMEAGVAALIVEVIYDMYVMVFREKQWFFSLMAPAVFVLNYVFKINVALLIAGSVFICILKAGLARRKERRTS